MEKRNTCIHHPAMLYIENLGALEMLYITKTMISVSLMACVNVRPQLEKATYQVCLIENIICVKSFKNLKSYILKVKSSFLKY